MIEVTFIRNTAVLIWLWSCTGICYGSLLQDVIVEKFSSSVGKNARSDLSHLQVRDKRQVPRPAIEAINEAEGRLLDPAILSMMFSTSGVMPSVGSSTMSNA